MEMTMEDNNSKEYGQYDATHEEIAKEMGKSRAYVSLIEKEALEKLRKKLLWKHNVASVDDLLWFTGIKNYLNLLDNPRVKAVVDLTAQLWQLTPISLEMEKVEVSKPMTIELQRSVIPAIWTSIRESP